MTDGINLPQKMSVKDLKFFYGDNLALVERHVDVSQRLVIAIEEIKVADGDFLREILGA